MLDATKMFISFIIFKVVITPLIVVVVETGSYYVAQVGLKLVANLLPQLINPWDRMSVPPDSVFSTTSAKTPFPSLPKLLTLLRV